MLPLWLLFFAFMPSLSVDTVVVLWPSNESLRSNNVTDFFAQKGSAAGLNGGKAKEKIEKKIINNKISLANRVDKLGNQWSRMDLPHDLIDDSLPLRLSLALVG